MVAEQKPKSGFPALELFAIGAIFGVLIDMIYPALRKSTSGGPSQAESLIDKLLLMDSYIRFFIVPSFFGCSFTIVWLSLQRAIPKRIQRKLDSLSDSTQFRFFKWIPGLSLLLMIVVGVGYLIYHESQPNELHQMLAPLGGRATCGRRAYRNHLVISFPDGAKPKVERHDADLPRIVGIANRAKQQPRWKSIVLSLDHSNITDDGLKHLNSLPEGIGISLIETHVTAEGVDKLKAARPDLSIFWEAPKSTEFGE